MAKLNYDITNKAILVRNQFNIDNKKPINIFEELKKHKEYTIVFIPLSEKVRGFSHNEKGHKVIVINANDSIPQQNFSCAHELYHLNFDYDSNGSFVGRTNVIERNADKFAGAFLIPQEALYIYLQNHVESYNKIDERLLCEIERYFGVSRTALIIRLQEEGLFDSVKAAKYTTNIKSGAAHNGFNISYYEKNKDKYETIGEYITLAEELLRDGKITRSKYNEYLLDAFREDLVYKLPRNNDGNN